MKCPDHYQLRGFLSSRIPAHACELLNGEEKAKD